MAVPKARVTVVSLPLAELVEDLAIYPRHAVDEANVASLVRALEAGATLPPLVADHASKRITDGWHRARAYRRVLGAGAVVDVELRKYKGEADMVLDAIELNARHGRQLDKMDQVRCAHIAQGLGIELVRVAAVLHQPEAAVRKLLVRVATAPAGSRAAIPGTQTVVMKRPVLHLAGTKLTQAQADAQPTVPGTSYKLLARQLTDAVVLDLANREDESLMEAFRALRDALITYFA